MLVIASMAVEIEKKYRLSGGDRDRVKSAFRDVGADYIGREFEENTIFGGDVLAESGAIVRIRRTGARAILTYKRRVESSIDVKKQIEHEVEVSDADTVMWVLLELGLRPRLVYEKYRDTWRLRSVEIVVDELPFGWFMEIEGSITAIREAELLLGVGDLEVEHETYPMLTSRLGTNVGDVIEARFPSSRE